MEKIDAVKIGNSMLFCGNCFDVLPTLNIQADAIISDPPYGVTDCDWDCSIPLDSFWAMVEERAKPSANVVLFGCGKFSFNLIHSKKRWYRYDLVWAKNKKVGFLNANLQPMRSHESVLVFGRPGYLKEAAYNPQKLIGGRAGIKTTNHRSGVYDHEGAYIHVSDGLLHPGSVLPFNSETGQHPTQKPLALMEWLVRTYSNEDDLIIDPFMGSGTTGVACMNLKRNFIGIERERQYFDIACERIKKAYAELG